ncbi:hypothetical protein N9H96_01740, partial [Porticoccaceae bacterium]|nr:hypothetical protein [Porticoccaceae bacterium]
RSTVKMTSLSKWQFVAGISRINLSLARHCHFITGELWGDDYYRLMTKNYNLAPQSNYTMANPPSAWSSHHLNAPAKSLA